MKRSVIFGAGDLGQTLYSRIKENHEILFFVDNNWEKIAQSVLPVLSPSVLSEREFDTIYIASSAGLEKIYEQLTVELGICPQKINRLFSEYWQTNGEEPSVYGNPARIKFLEGFALYAFFHSIDGQTAEAGVFRGDFAKEINRVFPDRKLYLYDTFSGFDDTDIYIEETKNPTYALMPKWLEKENCFKDTSVELLCSNLINREMIVIKKGFFPDTFEEHGEKFAFVNLDLDLYSPIKAGLELFWPRMSRGGVILVHDYYGKLGGAARAVDEFTAEYGVRAIPIGDFLSIAIVKN